MRLSIVSLGLACLLAAPPSPAGEHHRVAPRRTDDGDVARTHGTLVHGSKGRAWHAGGTAGDGEGHFGHARASGLAGPDGRIAGGHRTSLDGDGTITRQGGVVAQGANGGAVRGGRRVQRGPDGSLQAGYTVNGQGAAGGSFSRGGSRARDADGARTASRQTQASGTRGSYAGHTTRADGTLDHASTIAGTNGNTYQGQTRYTRDEGLSHAGTCTNAQGQTFDCR